MPWPWIVFMCLGLAISLFHGVYAVTIWFRAPDLSKAQEEALGTGVWKRGWSDMRLHPWFLHQFWFNFVGSVLGWTASGYAAWRLSNLPVGFGWAEAGLLLIGAIGMVGYLPNTIHRIVGGIGDVAEATRKYLSSLIAVQISSSRIHSLLKPLKIAPAPAS